MIHYTSMYDTNLAHTSLILDVKHYMRDSTNIFDLRHFTKAPTNMFSLG